MNQNLWKPPAVQNRGRWWLIYRLAPFATFTILAGLFGYLVWQPFFHPRVYLLFASADYPVALLPPHSSATEDLAAIHVQQAALLNAPGGKDPPAAGTIASPAALDATLDRLESPELHGRDVLIVWVGAQVAARRGEVDLLCENFDPMDVQAGRYPFARLLERVRACPCRTKLIVLDSGWTVHLPRLGVLADCSAQQIRSLVEDTKDPSLWVVLAHADFESSFTIAEPHRSALAHFLGEGLQGAADRNSDRFVDLGELYHYTQERLADWVRNESGGRGSQTAVLLWGGGLWSSDMSFPVILPVVPKKTAEAGQQAAGDADSAPPELHMSKPPSRLPAASLPAAAVAATKAADKSEKPEKAAAAKSASDPVLTASAAELQAMAWSLHDRLVAAPDFRAIDEFPQFWRALQDRLLALPPAAKSTDANPDAAAMTGELRRLVRQMTDLAEGRAPQRYQPHDLVPTMSQWAQPLEVQARLPTLALAKRLGRPVPADLLAAEQHFDAAIEKPDGADFRKWIAELPPQFDAYLEFRLARRLAGQPDLDWPSIRLALKARRLAETVAVETLESGDWTRAQIERADRFRLAGERGLLAGVRPEEASQAVPLLQRAIDEYEQADAWNRDVVALANLTSEALFCMPAYLHWLITSIPDADAVSPDPVMLEQLIGNLERSLSLLDRPSAVALPDVRRLRHELESLLDTWHKRVLTSAEQVKFPSGDAVPSPQSPGPGAAEMRLRLLGLPDLSRDLGVGAGKTRASSPHRDAMDRLRPAARLYAAAALLVLGDLPEHDKKASAFAAAARFDDKSADAVELRKACARLGDAACDLLASLPDIIQRVSAENQDLTDPAKRARQIRNLRAARRLLYLVHPWDVERMDFTGPGQLLRRAELYDLLVWQQQRVAAEIADAQAADLPSLLDAANSCGRAAAAIPWQPPITAILHPGLAIESPGQIDLANKLDHEFPVSVTNHHGRDVDVWLAVDYDARTMTLQARNQAILYDADSVRRMPGLATGPEGQQSVETYPTNPKLDALRPTFKLQPGETKTLWVQLHRKTLAGSDAIISFHAISQADSVRHDLMAVLPHRLSVDLVAEGIADSWQSHDAVLTFYPYPNRATPYTLSLTNAGPVDRVVDLEILRSESPVSVPSFGDVSREAAQEYLARLGTLGRVLKVEKIAVAAGGRRVPIPFAAPTEPPPKPPAAPATTAAEAAPAAAAAEKKPLLASDLLAVITDCATGRRAIKRIEILTQRPARYVRPRVEYDAQRRRVDIVVQPIRPSVIPPEGVWIEGQPDEIGPVDLQHRSGAWLRPGASEVTVHVEVPRDSRSVFPILVNVDGFERAFRYEVPVDATTRTLVPESGRVDVRILEPQPGTCYGPKTSEVPLSLQVDAPHGLLLDGNSFVEVGIDTNRDRELRHKETLRLTSDRQVDLVLDAMGANGVFVIRTKVSDLHVVLPPPKLKAMRADLLARVRLATSDVWSEPIEVIFDDEPPRLSRLQLAPGATVTQGNELEISVLASDNELSGVAKVEAAFDLQRKGEFSDPPPVPASMQADGRWSLKLPTKPLRPGVYGLLVRATDRVGNTSEYLKAAVEVVSPDNDAAKRTALGRISGRVVYGRFDKRPVGGVPVQLIAAKSVQKLSEVTTDDEGHFTMVDVPPGDYKLKAEKLIAGNRRSVQMDIKVPVPPAAAEPVELILVTPR